MYLHSKDYEIRFTDVDFNDYIKLSSLLALMEESACLSAEELGFGYTALKPKNVGFILVNWYVKLFKPVKLGETLTVNTWPIAPKKLTVFRDFEFTVNGEKIGVATSRWCLVDLADFSVLPTNVIFDSSMSFNDFRSVEFNGWKIPAVANRSAADYVKYASYSDYDHYNHINNTKYGDLLLDAFAPEELRGKVLQTAQITYVKQCKYGEKIEFFKEQTADGYYLVEGWVNGEPRIQMKIKFAVVSD